MRTPIEKSSSRFPPSRSGLAPLELVLWLPVLLFVSALIVNLGTMTVWRVRGEVVARDVIWRNRWPRTGYTDPRPESKVWPAEAQMEVAGTNEVEELDDPAVSHSVVRGPLPNGFRVSEVLDPRRGAARGLAEIDRPFPLLSNLGTYRSGQIEHPLLDLKWTVAELGVQTNMTRRMRLFYRLPTADSSLSWAFSEAYQALISIPHYFALAVLDHDQEVRRLHGKNVDFHPRITHLCHLDPREIKSRRIDHRLLDVRQANGQLELGGISQLPRTLTEFFLEMYRAELRGMEAQVPQPPPEQLDAVRSKIEQLEEYQSRLPEIERELKAR